MTGKRPGRVYRISTNPNDGVMEIANPKPKRTRDEDILSQSFTNPEKFDELYKKYRHDIEAFQRLRTASKEDAEDLMQETFRRAFASRKEFQGNASFKSWLYRIAFNCNSTHHRKLTTIRKMLEAVYKYSSSYSEPSVDPSGAELPIVQKALLQIDPINRGIIILSVTWGFSIKEVSEIVGLSESTVRRRKREGLWRLQQQLTPVAPLAKEVQP